MGLELTNHVNDKNIDESIRLEELCYKAMGRLFAQDNYDIPVYMNKKDEHINSLKVKVNESNKRLKGKTNSLKTFPGDY